MGGDQDFGDAQGLGDGAGMEWASAAEGYEGEIAGVVASFDGDDADGFGHVGFYDAENAGGEVFGGGERALELVHAGAGGVEVESDGATRRVEYDVIERAHTIFDWKAALAGRRAEEAEAERSDPNGAGGRPKRARARERA